MRVAAPMRSLGSLTLALLALWTAPPVIAQEDPSDLIDAYVDALMSCPDIRIPGLAMSVVLPDSTPYENVSGVLEVGQPEAVARDTIFNLGSTSRMFTAAVLASLKSDDRIDWQDRVAERIPGLAARLESVNRGDLTLVDLLTDHSNFAPNSAIARFDLEANSLSIDGFASTRFPLYEPSRSFRKRLEPFPYGFTIAAAVAEEVTGTPWSTLARNHLEDGSGDPRPLDGLFFSTSEVLTEHPDRYAAPHALDENGNLVTLPRSVNLATEGASVPERGALIDLATATEFARDLVWEFSGFMTSPAFTDTFDFDWRSRYPRGLQIEDDRVVLELPDVTLGGLDGSYGSFLPDGSLSLYQFLYVSPTGGTHGMSSLIANFQSEDVAVTILTNQHGLSTRTLLPLAVYARDLLMQGSSGFSPETACEAASATPIPVDRSADFPALPVDDRGWAGTYRNPLYGEAVVATTGGGAFELALGPRSGLVRDDGGEPLWATDGFAAGWYDHRARFDPARGVLELDLRKGEGGPDFVVFRRDQVQTDAPPAAPEGGADHTVAFTITRLNGTDRTATVEVDLDASSTAAQGADFTGPSFPVTVRFEPGETEKSVEVTVLGDAVVEPDETIVLALAEPTGGTTLAGGVTATHTIVNDDNEVPSGATLAVEKLVSSGDGGFAPGSTIDYTVVITNVGPGDQPDLAGDELVDVLPPELELLSAGADVGTAAADPTTNTVTWDGGLGAGVSATIEIQARIAPDVPLGAPISNQATVSYDSDGDGTADGQVLSDDPRTSRAGDPTTLLVAADGPTEIPVLGPWGAAALALLLAATGWLVMRRLGP